MIQFHVMRDDVYGFGRNIELRCRWDVNAGDTECIGSTAVRGRGYIEDCLMSQVATTDHVIIKPFLTLTAEQAQQIVDAFWKAGIQPSNGAGSVGQLAATERHLADIRKIAFKKLDIKEG